MAIRINPVVLPDSIFDPQRGAEETIARGRDDTASYRPFTPEEDGIKVWRDPQAEAIPVGADDKTQYRPLRSSVPDLPLASATPGGAGELPSLDDDPIIGSAGVIHAPPKPGTRGAGGVLQMSFLEVAAGLAAGVEALTGGALGADTRRALEGEIAEVFRSLSPDVQADLQREFTDLGPEGVLRNPSSFGYQLLKQGPIFASLAVPGMGGAMVGGRIMVGAAMKRGASEAATLAARRKGITVGATVGGTTGESAVVGGMTAGEIMSGIENASDKVLMDAPKYRAMREQGMSEADAKRELMNELGRREGRNVAAGSAVLNLIPAYVLGRMLSGATRGKRAAGEALIAQPVTEMMQEPFEGYREDVAARESYDPSRVPGADSLERMVAGGALGLGSGGAMVGAGYVGRRILGVDKIAEGNRKAQELGGEDVAGALPVPPPADTTPLSQQLGLDLDAPVQPPPPEGPGTFTTRRGDQRAIPEAAPAPAEPEPFTPKIPETPYTTRAGEQRVAPAEPARGEPEPTNKALEDLEYDARRLGLTDRLTGKLPSKADLKKLPVEQRALVSALTAARKADPEGAARARWEQLEAAEDNWFDTEPAPEPKPGKKGPVSRTVRVDRLRPGLPTEVKVAAIELAELRRRFAQQTGMDLPQAEPGTVTRRAERQAIRQKIMDRAATATRALPEPEGAKAARQNAADDALYQQEMAEITPQLAVLEEQDPKKLSEPDAARLAALQKRRTAMRRSPAGQRAKVKAEAEAQRQGEAEQKAAARERGETRRQRAAEPAVRESGDPMPMTGTVAAPSTVAADNIGRGLRLRAQDPQALESRAAKLTRRLRGLEAMAEKRPLSKKEQQELSRGKTELAQLQAEIDQLTTPAGTDNVQRNITRAEQAVVEAEAELKRLVNERPATNKRTGKVVKADETRLRQAREAAKVELDNKREALAAEKRQLLDATPKPEPQARPEDAVEASDTTGDLFGGQTVEDEIARKFRVGNFEGANTPAEVRKLTMDAVRASLLSMVGSPYSKGVTRSMNRLKAKLITKLQRVKTGEEALHALRVVAADMSDVRFGDTNFDVGDLLARAHRLLAGAPMPMSGGKPVPMTVADFNALVAEQPRTAGRTEAVIEGADLTEVEFDAREGDVTGDVADARATEALELAELAAGETDEATQEALAEQQEALLAELSDAELAIYETEVAEQGRLSEETSDALDAAVDIDMERDDITAPGREEALAEYITSEEAADPFAITLAETKATNLLQRVVDMLGRNETEGLLQRLVTLLTARSARRILRQTIATFSPDGMFRQHADARQVLDRWRGNVMLHALQTGDSQLQTAASLLSEEASPELQTVWFVRALHLLADNNPQLDISVKRILDQRDTALLRSLGEISIQLHRQLEYGKLGEQFTTLTNLTDEQLLAMPRDDLRKLVNSRLGIPMPRKGELETGYTKEKMVAQLRAHEALMRSTRDYFVEQDPNLHISAEQWRTMIADGLMGSNLTDEQMALTMKAFADGLTNPVTLGGRTLPAGVSAAAENLRHVLSSEILPTSPKTVAKAQNISQREAAESIKGNIKRVNSAMNRISEQFRREVNNRLKAARPVPGTEGFLSPERMADRAAARIENERIETRTSEKRESAAQRKLRRAQQKQREALIEAYDPDLATTREALGSNWDETEIKAMYRRHGLPVPGEAKVPRQVQGAEALLEERVAEARLNFGNDNPLEGRISELPSNWFNRLNSPDNADLYLDTLLEQVRRDNPTLNDAQIVSQVRLRLTERADSSAENKTGRLTDAQFLQLLDGLGVLRAHRNLKLGGKFDRKFVVDQILNSLRAFGRPIFTGGAFMDFVQDRALLGEPQNRVVAALFIAHQNVVQNIANYLNNGNEVAGSKSQLIEFIMNSERMGQTWVEANHDRRRLLAQSKAGRSLRVGEVVQLQVGGVWVDAGEVDTRPVADMTSEERKVLAARMDGVVAEYDRLMDRWATEPLAADALLTERNAANEILHLLTTADPDAGARAALERRFSEHIASLKERIATVEARIEATKKELTDARRQDVDYQREALRLTDLDDGTLSKKLRELGAFVENQRGAHKIAVRSKRMAEAKQITQRLAEAAELQRLITKHIANLKKGKGAANITGRQLERYVDPVQGSETRPRTLESTLAEHRKHLKKLNEQLELVRKEHQRPYTPMTVGELLARIVGAEQQAKQVNQNVQRDAATRAQLVEDVADAGPTVSRDAASVEARQIKRAQIWPRVEASLNSLIEWAVGADKAHSRLQNEIRTNTRNDAANAGMVTTSSMEAVAAYSNELIVGGNPVHALFLAKEDRSVTGVRNDIMPQYLRGPVKLLINKDKATARLRNAKVEFAGKTYQLADMARVELGNLRDKLAKQYAASGTKLVEGQLQLLRDYMTYDSQLRAAYVQAYALLGDIFMHQRSKYPKGKGVPIDTALKDLAESKVDVITSRAEPTTMTPQQRRAVAEERRAQDQKAAEEAKVEYERKHSDLTQDEEVAALEKAIGSNKVLKGFPHIGAMKRRLAQLNEWRNQTVDQAEAAIKATKQHMDLPVSEAKDLLQGSSVIGYALHKARQRKSGQPMRVGEALQLLLDSGALEDMTPIMRFFVQAAVRTGVRNIPIKWVNTPPEDGKAFLGRYVFSTKNPARGREILINQYAYDRLMEKGGDPENPYSTWVVEGRLAHAFVHELAHAMTHLRLLTDPTVQKEFGRLLGMARAAMSGSDQYGLTNVFEFVAEYFSNKSFQRDLHSIRINTDGTARTLWQRITDFVRAVLNVPRETATMFSYIADHSSALFMSEQQVENFAKRGGDQQLAQGYLNYEITMDAGMADLANAAELAAEAARRASTPWGNAWMRVKTVGQKLKLGSMTLDQIGESYAGLAQKYTDLQNRKWAEVNKDMDSATRLMQDFSALDPETAQRMSTMMVFATRFAIHPDHPLGPNTPNAHVPNSKEDISNHAILSEMYNALPAEAKAIYQQVKQRHAEDFAKTVQHVTANVMAAFNFDLDRLPNNWYETFQNMENAEARHEYLEQLWETHGLPDPKTDKKSERAFSREEADSLARMARRPKLQNGPYFPLSRFGKWVVRARQSIDLTFTNEAEMAKVLGEIKSKEPSAKFEGFGGESLSGKVSFQLTEMKETQAEAVKRRAELFKEPITDMKGRAILLKGQPLRWREIPDVAEKNRMAMYELAGHYSSSFMTKIQEKLGHNAAALAAVKEAYLQMLPDTSMRKHELKRGLVIGASTDMIRSFAATTKAAAYGNAQIKYGRLLSNEMQAMQQRVKNQGLTQQAVVNELQTRDLNTAAFMQESVLGTSMDRITEFGFVWFLGSPSYWMVNATQPYMLTLPFLSARYGTAASYAALARARSVVFPSLAGKAARSGLGLKALRRDPKAHREFMNDVFGGLDAVLTNIKDPGQQSMLQEVETMGLIDLTIAKDLNQTIKHAATGAVGKSWESVVDAARVMPHLVEVLNRSMTALAAYELAIKAGSTHEQATAVAVDTVRKTQFNYSAINKARFMSRTTSELIRPVMLFMQYAQHVYYLMLRSAIDGFSEAKTPAERKTARKTFYRIIAAHTLTAGALGGMIEPVRIALGLAFGLAQMVGLADEDDDLETLIQRAAHDILGETGGRTFSKGIPYGLLGMDLHGRIGLNNLFFMSDPRVKGMEGSEWLMHKMLGALGALGSTATSMADVPQKWRRGDIYGAITSAMPKGARDLMQAGRMQQTGVLDYNGNVIMDSSKIDTLSLAYKVVGIAPSSVSAMYSSRAAIKRVETRINKRRNRLLERWRRADSPNVQRSVLDEIATFNQNYPEFMIDGKARVQAKARRRENEQAAARQGGYFSSANARQQRRVQQYGEF